MLDLAVVELWTGGRLRPHPAVDSPGGSRLLVRLVRSELLFVSTFVDLVPLGRSAADGPPGVAVDVPLGFAPGDGPEGTRRFCGHLVA